MTGAPTKTLSDLQQGRAAAVYLFCGDELLAREGAQAIVDGLVPEGHRSLNVEVVADEEAASVPARLRTIPLFGGVKVVVVHDTRAFVSKQEIAGRIVAEGGETAPSGGGSAKVYEDLLAQGIPPGAVLILTAEIVDQRRALFKRIKEMGVVVDCGVRAGKVGETQMKPEVARARIAEAAERAHKRIAADALQAIVERTGFSVRALESELEKILLYVGSRTDVHRADVLAVLSNSREASIFDLTNALEAGLAAAALRALRALAVQREAPLSILGMMASVVRSLLLARCALDRHLDGRLDARMSYATFQARVLSRLTAEAAGDDRAAAKIREMHPFRAFNLLRAAARCTQAELVAGLHAIHDADLAVKTTGQPEGLILETLALTLCGCRGQYS